MPASAGSWPPACYDSTRLSSDGVRRRLGGFWIAEVLAGQDGEVICQPVAERDPGRNLEPHDVVITDPIDVLAQGSKAVAVGDHQHRPAPGSLGEKIGNN